MQKIVPHIWYTNEAKEAAEFYVASFGGDSRINSVQTIHNTPSGDCDIVSFTLWGHSFMSISAGPFFTLNPSISISVQCHDEAEIDRLYTALRAGGSDLMPLDKYPWSEKYAWISDKYGLSWQLNVFKDQDINQRINPALLFVGDQYAKAEEAMNFYVSVFPDSKINFIARYEEGQEPEKPGTITHADFELLGQAFYAMDSAREHKFAFNEAVSLIVNCDTQEEIDHYWEKLSAVPESEQCGWLKDKYSVSWQIVPTVMNELMASGDAAKIDRVTQAFLKMKKFDIVELRAAAEGK